MSGFSSVPSDLQDPAMPHSTMAGGRATGGEPDYFIFADYLGTPRLA